MGYNILRFKHNGKIQWGVLKSDTIAPFASGAEQLKEVIANHLEEAAAISKNRALGTIALNTVELLSPVTRPTRLLCLGVNYADHRAEAKGNQHEKQTLFFRKDESAITAPFATIPWPNNDPLLDYEVEMGMIIKKPIRKPSTINAQNIEEYIAGVILANDLSPRATMIFAPFGQWYKGKSWRNMCPLGPYIHIFEKVEVGKLHDLEIKLWVNEELRQDAHTSQMITKPEQALTEASAFVDLEVGDVVLTGTPGGVAIKAPSKFAQNIARLLIPEKKLAKMMIKGQLKSGKFLKEGDVIRCSLKSSDGSIDAGEQSVTIAYNKYS